MLVCPLQRSARIFCWQEILPKATQDAGHPDKKSSVRHKPAESPALQNQEKPKSTGRSACATFADLKIGHYTRKTAP